jgi:hypothetical protein
MTGPRPTSGFDRPIEDSSRRRRRANEPIPVAGSKPSPDAERSHPSARAERSRWRRVAGAAICNHVASYPVLESGLRLGWARRGLPARAILRANEANSRRRNEAIEWRRNEANSGGGSGGLVRTRFASRQGNSLPTTRSAPGAGPPPWKIFPGSLNGEILFPEIFERDRGHAAGPDSFRPFKPFTIVTASGESYHVSHPEIMSQSPIGDVVIVMPHGNEVVMIDVDSITEIAYGFGRKSKKSDA